MIKVSRIITAAAVLFCGLMVSTPRVHAAMPVGTFGYTNSDAANALWDLSQVTQLQDLNASVSKLDATIHYTVGFTQDGAGKLSGSGTTTISVSSAAFSGTVSGAEYKVVGKISSKSGQAKLVFVASAQGNALIDGKDRLVKSVAARSLTFDSVAKSISGQYRNSASAAGLGGGSEAGDLSLNWTDVQSALGDGGWKLSLTLTDAGNNKLLGIGTVTFDTGAQWLFGAKGVYNSHTDSTKLVLIPTTDSKGSSLKVTMTGASITAISGKVSGQSIKIPAQ